MNYGMAGRDSGHFSFYNRLESPSKTFFGDAKLDFLISSGEKLSHCETESGFRRRDGQKERPSMVSIHAAHRVESATDDILLTIIFWTTKIEKTDWSRNFSARSPKTARPSVYGEASI